MGTDIQMTPDMAGWPRMWACIAATYGDAACLNPQTNETWQYMGTYEGQHQFRHRSLPVRDGRRTYANVPVAPGDFATIIEPATVAS